MRDKRWWIRDDEVDEEALRRDPRARREPSPDPALERALANAERVLYGESPNGSEVIAARARIVADARPLLARLAARLRPAPRWWEWTASWSRAAIPIGAVAGIAAALLVVASHERTARVIRERTLQGQPAVMRAAMTASPTPELLESLIGPASGEWLISKVFEGTAMARAHEVEIRDTVAPED